MAVNARQTNTASGFGTALNCALLSNALAASLIAAGADGHSDDSSTVDSVNTLNLAVVSDDAANGLYTSLHYVENATAGAHTITRNQVADDQSLVIAEFTGFPASAGRIDQVAPSSLGFSTSATSGACPTTTQIDELCIGYVSFESAGSPATATGSFSEETEVGSARPGMLASRIVAAMGAFTFTATLAPTPNWVCVMATFKMNVIPKPEFSFRRKALRPRGFAPGIAR